MNKKVIKNLAILTTGISLGLGAINVEQAHATTFQFGDSVGSFDLGTGWVGQGENFTLNIKWEVNEDLKYSTFDLNDVGDMYTFYFGKAIFGLEDHIEGPQYGQYDETNNLDLAVNLDLLMPETLSLSSIGEVKTQSGYTCDYETLVNNGQYCDYYNLTDKKVTDVLVEFASTEITFGNTGKLGLEFSPIKFYDDYSVSKVKGKFTLLQADSPAKTPEPASILGLLTVLGAGSILKSKKIAS